MVRAISAAVVALSLCGAGAWLTQKFSPSFATFSQNDNLGQFVLTFDNISGISSRSESVTIGKSMATLADGALEGYFVSSAITPTSSGGWRNLQLEGAWGRREEVKIQMLYCDGTPVEEAFLAGNSAGVQLSSTNEIDLSSVPDSVGCLQAKVLLSATTNEPAPVVTKLTVNWLPRTVYLARLTATETTQAGAAINYKVDYSVSYADGAGVVLYVPLPDPVAGSYTASYEQSLAATFYSASNGGHYTDTAITVDGVDIPANSVYWEMGDIKAGVSGSVSFVLNTQNGWESGVRFEAQAVIGSSASPLVESEDATTTVISTPRPEMIKDTSNTIEINNVAYAYERAPYNSLVNYNLIYRNFTTGSTLGMETLFSPVVTDDLSKVFAYLTNFCGVTDPTSRVVNISDSGVVDGTNLTWRLADDIGPMGMKQLSYAVDYRGCAENGAGESVENVAIGKSDKTPEAKATSIIKMFGVPEVNGNVAKGENGSVHYGVDDQAPQADPTSMQGKVAYGGTTTYNLRAQNSALLQLRDIVMQDKIPEGMTFVSASLPTAAQGKIYYYTATDHGDPEVAPEFDYQNTADTGRADGWTTTVPADAASVQWVTMYVPCLKGGIPAGITSDCDDRPSSVTGSITVRVNPVADVCQNTVLENHGVFRIYRAASSVDRPNEIIELGANGQLGQTITDLEPSLAVNPLPVISGGSSLIGPEILEAGQSGTYTISIRNSSATTATRDDTLLRIEIPSVKVGNQIQPLEYQGFTGGEVSVVRDPATQRVIALEVHPGVLAPSSTKTYNLTLGVPRGAMRDETFTVAMALTAHDPNGCQTVVASSEQQTTITGLPELNTIKSRQQNLIEAAETIDYQIRISSTGKVSTTNTYVVDQIPNETIFEQVDCPEAKCTVYFAAAGDPELPSVISPTDQISAALIRENFSLGVQNGDIWTPPASMPKAIVGYIAYLIGDPDGESRVLGVNDSVAVNLRVKNDQDGAGASENGSVVGTVISNQPVVISDQTLQAIGNTVHTTVLPSPGLAIDKTNQVAGAVQAGDSFDWLIEYSNNGSQHDTSVVITDTLPAGVKLTGLYNTWNEEAIKNGARFGGYDLLDPANNAGVSVTENADGTTSIVINLVPEQRGVPLGLTEGGVLRMTVEVAEDQESGTFLNNHIEGCYSNEVEGPLCVSDDDAVEVQNPDLYLYKTVSNTTPHRGATVSYTLTISNEGRVDAPNVQILDTLPAGVCYVNGSTSILNSSWEIGQPTVSAGDCAIESTTLTWTVDAGNTLKRNDLARGLIPGSSESLKITYSATVHDEVAFGSKKENFAHVRTSVPEDDNYPNDDRSQLTTATPDPYVEKTASSVSVLPGEVFNYTIGYGNTADERASGVYIVDGLPDIEGADGRTDITLLSVTAQNQEQIYYYDANVSGELPELSADYNYAADTRFKTSLTEFDPRAATPSYPTHMIIVNAGKNGGGEQDYYEYSGQITIEAQATDPYTGAILPAGVEWLNHVWIDSATEDGDLTNNEDSVTVALPRADLSITKTGDVEGSYPGLAPGEMITYTINYRNSGIGSVCGVHIQDFLPLAADGMPLGESFGHNFMTVQITDAQGNAMQLLDRSGSPLDGGMVVPVGFDSSNPNAPKWYFGNYFGDPEAADYYLNICLPTGAQGEFQVTLVTDRRLADTTEIVNRVHIDQDSGADEQVLSNNDDDSTTMVYRADLVLTKTGVSAGVDGEYGTADDSTEMVNPGEQVRYRLEYNNIGNITAKNSVIEEEVPFGTCFTVGSIEHLPATAIVSYSNDDGSTWDYTPQPSKMDCNVTNFRIELGDLSAPANMLTGRMELEADSGAVKLFEKRLDLLDQTSAQQVAVGNYHACALAADKADPEMRKIYCWGHNNMGQLGTGDRIDSHGPVPVDMSVGFENESAKQVVAGENFSCGLAVSGKAYCWGADNLEQLGSGAVQSADSPLPVRAGATLGPTLYTQLAAGKSHVCGLAEDGRARCWGANASGQLGVGYIDAYHYESEPVKTPEGVKFVQLAAGGDNTCAVTDTGQVYCWGASSSGRLGNDMQAITQIDEPQLIAVANAFDGKAVSQIAASKGYSTCALTTDGQAYCWGQGIYGGLGVGDGINTVYKPTAVDTTGVLAGKTLTQITAGYNHTCAIDTEGQAYCWGLDSSNQLGNGSSIGTAFIPVAVEPETLLKGLRLTDISGGAAITCAVANDANIYCWGADNYGVLGNGDGVSNNDEIVEVGVIAYDVDPSSVEPFRADSISTESYGVGNCALRDGVPYCWGNGAYGQLGNGTDESSPVPVPVDMTGAMAGKTIVQLANSYYATCALTNDGHVYCWGYNAFGQLGDIRDQDNNLITNSNLPIELPYGDEIVLPVRAISNAAQHVCLSDATGKVYCWGLNGNGQLGVPLVDPIEYLPVAVDTSRGMAGKVIVQLSATIDSTCALDQDGQIYCWGMNNFGQLGSTEQNGASGSPVLATAMDMTGFEGNRVVSIGVSSASACALTENEKVYCWGGNIYGQLGNGTSDEGGSSAGVVPHPEPAEIKMDGALQGLTIKQLSAGLQHACVLASDDRIYCWGTNVYGSMGDGSNWGDSNDEMLAHLEPEAVSPDLSGVLGGKQIVQVGAGTYYTCAMDNLGYIYCWGWNSYGELGTGILDSQVAANGPYPAYVMVGLDSPTSGTKSVILAADAGATINNYENLFIEQVVGATTFPNNEHPDVESTVKYHFKQNVGGVCNLDSPDVPGYGSPIWTTSGSASDSTMLDISGLSKAVRSWCIVAEYLNVGDIESTARMSYASPDNPYVTFEVKVDDQVTRTTLNNRASIDTPTPEVTKDNNSDNYQFTLLQADLALEKSVDLAAVDWETAKAGAKLTYELLIRNLGPNDAREPSVEDTLPADVTLVAANQTASSDGAGGESTVNFTCTAGGGVIDCGSTESLKVGESATITLEVTINGDVPDKARLMNQACVTAKTADVNWDNNCDEVMTTITSAPNIWSQKTGPATATIGSEYEYTIEFGNNGNTAAADFILQDKLDANVTLVQETISVEMSAGAPIVTCGQAFGQHVINCTAEGGSLPAGTSGVIRFRVKVAEEQSLVDNETVLHNEVCANTSGSQTDLSDDCATHDVKVVQGEPGRISGTVYVDLDADGHHDPADGESGIEGVAVHLAGTDTKGRTVDLTIVTDAQGYYEFGNLYPGTYTIVEEQPAPYSSTASFAGYSQVDAQGLPDWSVRTGKGSMQDTAIDKNQIVGIMIIEGDYNRENNFGELAGIIGNLVWHDLDRDSFADEDEPGIAGVEVTLYQDMDADGHVSEDDRVLAKALTDQDGYYYFEMLDFGIGLDYLVEVTDSNKVLGNGDGTIEDGEYEPMFAPAGNSADGKPYYITDGYSAMTREDACYNATLRLVLPGEVEPLAMSISPDAPGVNLTADFGYALKEAEPPEPCTGDDCPCVGDECPEKPCEGENCPEEPCVGDECGEGPTPPDTGLMAFVRDAALPAGIVTVVLGAIATGFWLMRRISRKGL